MNFGLEVVMIIYFSVWEPATPIAAFSGAGMDIYLPSVIL